MQCYIGGSITKGFNRTLRFVFWVVVLLQQQAQIGRMAGSNLPPALLQWYRLLLLLELNPSAGLPPQCAGGGSYADVLPVLYLSVALITVPVWFICAFDLTPIAERARRFALRVAPACLVPTDAGGDSDGAAAIDRSVEGEAASAFVALAPPGASDAAGQAEASGDSSDDEDSANGEEDAGVNPMHMRQVLAESESSAASPSPLQKRTPVAANPMYTQQVLGGSESERDGAAGAAPRSRMFGKPRFGGLFGSAHAMKASASAAAPVGAAAEEERGNTNPMFSAAKDARDFSRLRSDANVVRAQLAALPADASALCATGTRALNPLRVSSSRVLVQATAVEEGAEAAEAEAEATAAARADYGRNRTSSAQWLLANASSSARLILDSATSSASSAFSVAKQRVVEANDTRRAEKAAKKRAAEKKKKQKKKSCRAIVAQVRYVLGACMVLMYPLVTVSALEMLHCVPPPSSAPQLGRGGSVLFSRMRVQCFTPSHTAEWLLALATLLAFSIAWPLFSAVRLAHAVAVGGRGASSAPRGDVKWRAARIGGAGGDNSEGGTAHGKAVELTAMGPSPALLGAAAPGVGTPGVGGANEGTAGEAERGRGRAWYQLRATPDACGDRCGWGARLVAYQGTHDAAFAKGWRSITGTDYRPRIFYLRLVNFGTFMILALCRTVLAPSALVLAARAGGGARSGGADTAESEESQNAMLVLLHLGRLFLILASLLAPMVAIILTCPFKQGSRWKMPLRVLVLLLTMLLSILNFSSFVATNSEQRAESAAEVGADNSEALLRESRGLLWSNTALAYVVLVYTAFVLAVLFGSFAVFVVCRGAQFERRERVEKEEAARAEEEEAEHEDIAIGLSALHAALPPPPPRARRPALSFDRTSEAPLARYSAAPPDRSLALAIQEVDEGGYEGDGERRACVELCAELSSESSEEAPNLQLVVSMSTATLRSEVPVVMERSKPAEVVAYADPPSALVARWKGLCLSASNPHFRSHLPPVLERSAQYVRVVCALYDSACASFLAKPEKKELAEVIPSWVRRRGSSLAHGGRASTTSSGSSAKSAGGGGVGVGVGTHAVVVTPALILRLLRERAKRHMIAHNLVAQLELVQLMGACDDASAARWSEGTPCAAQPAHRAQSAITRGSFLRAILLRALRRPDGPVALWIADEVASAPAVIVRSRSGASGARLSNGARGSSDARGSLLDSLFARASFASRGSLSPRHRRGMGSGGGGRRSIVDVLRGARASGLGGDADATVAGVPDAFASFARSYSEMGTAGDGPGLGSFDFSFSSGEIGAESSEGDDALRRGSSGNWRAPSLSRVDEERAGARKRSILAIAVDATTSRSGGGGVAVALPLAGSAAGAVDRAWQQVWDESSGSHYWFNTTTGVTQWDAPASASRPVAASLHTTSSVGEEQLRAAKAAAEAAAAAAGADATVWGWRLLVENERLLWRCGPGATERSWSLPLPVAKVLVLWTVAHALQGE